VKRVKRIIFFDGISSEDMGVDLNVIGLFQRPERDVETVDVPGRNGSLIIDNARYKNVSITYGCKIWRKTTEEFRNAYDAFADFLLLHQSSYYRLEDSGDPDHYRLARYSGGIEPDVTESWDGARFAEFDIEFDCKPQGYRVDGDQMRQFTSGSTLYNPTRHTASPLIRVYGTGAVTIGDVIVNIASGASSYVDLDCDLHMAYEGPENRAQIVTLNDWPALSPGINAVSYDSTIMQVEIMPRWWDL
jgi:phage-related protein